jgi:hypothetical protein
MLAPLLATLLTFAPSPELNIEFWHGPDAVFGAIGRPQRQINILGNVFADAGVDELYYALDGGPELLLSVGPDTRRLLLPGDFNIELFLDDLSIGEHEVVVRAVDNDDNEMTRAHQFTVIGAAVWPLPYTAQWSTAFDVTSAAQGVDGQWLIEADGVRCPTPGYDRLLAIGDTTWTNYEVTVPVTIHAIDPNGYNPPSFTPGLGIVLRWNGHTDFLKPGSQPSIGYWPLGGIAEFVYHVDQCGPRFQLYGNPFTLRDQDDFCTPHEFGVTYLWKFRVLTLGNGKHEYKFKVWEQGDPEPAGWFLSMLEDASEPAHGSLLLLAHHVDATFGDVVVTPLNHALPAKGDLTPDRRRARRFGDRFLSRSVNAHEFLVNAVLRREINVKLSDAPPGAALPVVIKHDVLTSVDFASHGDGESHE